MVAGSRAKREELRAAMARGPESGPAPVILRPPKYTISDAFRILCKRTNGHGWYRIHRARSLKGTCFWFVLTAAAFSFSVAYYVTLWTRYIRFTTETSIHTSLGTNPFPSVTLCPLSPIKEGLITNPSLPLPPAYRTALHNASAKVWRTLEEQVYKDGKLKRLPGNTVGEIDIHLEAHQNIINAREYSTKAARQSLGYKINELLSYCTFDGKSCAHATDWTYYLDDAYGNCYTWSRPSTKVAAGVTKGLHLILSLQGSEYLSWATEALGARVSVHEAGVKPQPMSEGISVGPGQAVELGLRLETHKRLDEPYNDVGCGDQGNFTAAFSWAYSAAACRESCRQLHVVRRCACSDPRQPLANADPCNVDDRDTIACLTQAEEEYEQNPDGNCHCPPACEESRWRGLLGLANWPPKGISVEAFRNKYGVAPRDASASLRVFYNTPAATHYEELPTETWAQFLGWVGGQLAVWTGASTITIIEFIVFLIAALLVLCTENVDWLLADKVDPTDPNYVHEEEEETEEQERLREEMEAAVVPRSHFHDDAIPEETTEY